MHVDANPGFLWLWEISNSSYHSQGISSGNDGRLVDGMSTYGKEKWDRAWRKLPEKVRKLKRPNDYGNQLQSVAMTRHSRRYHIPGWRSKYTPQWLVVTYTCFTLQSCGGHRAWEECTQLILHDVSTLDRSNLDSLHQSISCLTVYMEAMNHNQGHVITKYTLWQHS